MVQIRGYTILCFLRQFMLIIKVFGPSVSGFSVNEVVIYRLINNTQLFGIFPEI